MDNKCNNFTKLLTKSKTYLKGWETFFYVHNPSVNLFDFARADYY